MTEYQVIQCGCIPLEKRNWYVAKFEKKIVKDMYPTQNMKSSYIESFVADFNGFSSLVIKICHSTSFNSNL